MSSDSAQLISGEPPRAATAITAITLASHAPTNTATAGNNAGIYMHKKIIAADSAAINKI